MNVNKVTLVQAEPARVIVRRLVQAGLTVAAISRETGIPRITLDGIYHGKRERVKARTLGIIVKKRNDLAAMAPRTIGRWTRGGKA